MAAGSKYKNKTTLAKNLKNIVHYAQYIPNFVTWRAAPCDAPEISYNQQQDKKMKKTKIKWWMIALAVVAVALLWGVGCYNGMVGMDEEVGNKWANVETQYQRRADLIPNLVNTVKGYAKHEQQTLENVVSARSRATQVTIDPSNATPEQIAAFQKAQGEVSQALGRLLAVTENYPELKANENFKELQSQLEGTENRITVARKDFNDAARAYNVAIRRFPRSIVAGLCGFEKRAYFEAEAGAEKAPKVEF